MPTFKRVVVALLPAGAPPPVGVLIAHMRTAEDPVVALERAVRRYLAQGEHPDGFTWGDVRTIPVPLLIEAGLEQPEFVPVYAVQASGVLEEPEERILPPPAAPGGGT